MDNFKEVSKDQLQSIISSLSSATCCIDPLPTPIVKQCLDTLLPVFDRIVNLSLLSGVFPAELKQAVIKPHLKKPNLDSNLFKNYRPVSNIPFLSNIIEKSAISQLDRYMSEHNMHEPHQSAYRVGHSTETALVRIHNDIAREMDKGRGVILDLSAAFDTIDHTILHERMEGRLSVQNSALSWFDSYHSNRSQRVVVRDASSKSVILKFGGPQRSLIGAEDYKVYTLPVGDIIRKHLRFEIYADDTQIYVSFVIQDQSDLDTAVRRIEKCILEVKQWMTRNLLKLNSEKTGVLYITPPHLQSKLECKPIEIDSATVISTTSARNIGVIFDRTLSLHEHISSICKSSVYQLRNISAIRRFIPQSACESLIHALVTCRLEYANALFIGLPKYQIDRLQKVQNIAARVVYRRQNLIT